MKSASLHLESTHIAGLPVVNYFFDRLGLDELLGRYVPHSDRRCQLPPAVGLGLMVRNVLLGRAPLYALEEWAAPFEPSLLRLAPEQARLLNDDRVGRTLDHLFDADRASLLTEVVVRAVRVFDIRLEQLHNDSTTVTFSGQYSTARGGVRRERPTLRITHGHNKDHRPDLKQILWILTVSADGAVPVHFRAADGNTTDDRTHIETWTLLRQLVGRADFLYVADCKLCTRLALNHIASHGGRFLTVLPRTRREDGWFRDWVQTHNPLWVEARRRQNPRRREGPLDVYRVAESPIRSAEGYRIVWVWSSRKAEQDARARHERIEKSVLALEILETRLRGKRARFRDRAAVTQEVDSALRKADAQRWIDVTIQEVVENSFQQERAGRPSANTRYVRHQRPRFHLEWRPRTDSIDYDAKTDGMFPLLTNDDLLSAATLLEKYKYQPQLEKRHEQLKTVRAIAPVFLKSVTRIEALMTIYFLALLVDALIERQMRRAMAAASIKSLPLYPEDRECRAPTTERLLDLFRDLQQHRLLHGRELVQVFAPQITKAHEQILTLLGVPQSAYAPVVSR
jgi:transposase